jgi:hypothetical protein
VKTSAGVVAKAVPTPVPNTKFRRIRYVRYADDFLVGVTASMQYSKSVRDQIKQFLQETLHLRLNMDKAKITHAYNEKAFFLGYLIKEVIKPAVTKATFVLVQTLMA